MRRIAGSRWIGTIEPPSDGTGREVVVIAPRAGGGDERLASALDPAFLLTRGTRALLPIAADSTALAGVVSFAPSSLYFDTVFRVRPDSAADLIAGGGGLTRVSAAWRIDAVDAVFNQLPWIGLVAAESLRSDARVALYRSAAGAPWRWVGREPGGRHTIGGSDRATGTFALLRDTLPPVIENFAMQPVGDDSLELRATIRDSGSGLDPEGIEMTIGGTWVPAEWDPERELVRYLLPRPHGAPAPPIRLAITDRAGNRAEATPR